MARILEAVGGIDHVERVRIHTRLPVVIPERVDRSLLGVLASCRQPVVMVLHVNHAHEIDDRVRVAVNALRGVVAMLLNQAVLLAGVNDRVGALSELGSALVTAGIVPYYLHLLDPVAGAAHFDVSETTARRLLGELSARSPGYLVPRLVREVEGASAKVLISPVLP